MSQDTEHIDLKETIFFDNIDFHCLLDIVKILLNSGVNPKDVGTLFSHLDNHDYQLKAEKK